MRVTNSINKISGLAGGGKLRMQARIWRENGHRNVQPCHRVETKTLQSFRERVFWRIPNLGECLEAEMAELIRGLICEYDKTKSSSFFGPLARGPPQTVFWGSDSLFLAYSPAYHMQRWSILEDKLQRHFLHTMALNH